VPPLFESKTMSNAPLIIRGGSPIRGTLEVNPSKNSALPIIAASLLTAEPVVLHGIPRLSDVEVILEIVASLGARWTWVGPHSLSIQTPAITNTETPYSLVAKMRASFEVLGPLLARAGEARVSMPGGCTFGPRPVDQHVKAFRAMGAAVVEENGDFQVIRDHALSGRVVFDIKTVGGTRNAMMAACLGTGMVRLENCALEPDVIDLANFLNTLGADIRGAGSSTIEIQGVPTLHGGEYRVMPDRIEAGTWMLATAASRGTLTLENVNVEHMRSLTARLIESGINVLELDGTTLSIDASKGTLKPLTIQAVEFPGFPTDLQPPMGAFLATVPGTSKISDRVYPTRLGYAQELARMGAKAEVFDSVLVIEGGPLRAAPVKAADIRAGAALVIAAIAAEGETRIEGVEFLNRGYERLEERLRAIGVDVGRTEPILALAI
jgi:UDP-N-acetylglucosamine 1-carboxyvinyltransferase